MKKRILIVIVVMLTFAYIKMDKETGYTLKKGDNLNKLIQELLYQPALPKVFDSEQLTNAISELITHEFTNEEQARLAVSLAIPTYTYDFAYNETKEYLNASTIKVPLAMYIYDLSFDDPNILNRQLGYDPQFNEESAGITQSAKEGDYFFVKDLLMSSIRYSDNTATNMLFNAFIGNITNCIRLDPYFAPANYHTWTSTSENKMYALHHLYDHQDMFHILLNDMKLSIYTDRIPKYLPKTVTVANKVGSINSTIHDFGIIFDPEAADYLLTISMEDIMNSDERMALLSKDIYRLIQQEIDALQK